jgi:aspartate aminotransferase
MKRISDLDSQIISSGTLAIKALALELKRKGESIIEFTAGEPDFPTPEKVKNAAIQAIRDNFTKYTAAAGIPELREAIAEKFRSDQKLNYHPDQIIVTNGAKHAIFEALQAILDEGDEVIIPVPYWTSYPEQVKLCKGIPVFVNTIQTGLKLTPENLEKAITPKTKAFIFNSPANPTGIVYTREEILALAEVLKKHSIYIISDEIYEKIIFDDLRHFSIATVEELFDRTIVINGFSKAYAMTGWRIGYAAGPKDVIQTMKKFQGHQTSNVNSITQKASIVAIREVVDEIEQMRRKFEKRRDLIFSMFSGLERINVMKPQGAFYIYPDFSQICKNANISTEDLVKRMIEKAHIVAVPGEAFGTPGFIRFSYATSENEIQEGIRRVLEFLSTI